MAMYDDEAVCIFEARPISETKGDGGVFPIGRL